MSALPLADARLLISELFVSVQGEGVLTGVPSVFVRTGACNLRCKWCDTPETSWEPGGEVRSVESVVAEVLAHDVRHVVLTGGEPLLPKAIEPLAHALHRAGRHLTIETAGTRHRDLPVDLWSLSPKLSSSVPDHPRWGARHDALRLNLEVLRRYVATGRYQLKLVLGDPAEIAEVDALVAALDAAPERVLLMPEGVDVARLDDVAEWLVPLCTERGFRFCDRLHIRLFGHTRGT